MKKFFFFPSLYPSLPFSLSSLIPTLSFSLSSPSFLFLLSFLLLPLSFPLSFSIHPYLILFYFALYNTLYLQVLWFFTSWKSAVALLRASLLLLFSNSICSLCVSISHFIHSHNMQTFLLLILFLLLIVFLWWSVLFNHIIIVLMCHKSCPYKIADFTDECCVCSECSTGQLFPFLFSSSWPHYFLRHINIVGQSLTLYWPVSVQAKGRVTSFSI